MCALEALAVISEMVGQLFRKQLADTERLNTDEPATSC